MKSFVSNYYPMEEFTVPELYFQIPIHSWEEEIKTILALDEHTLSQVEQTELREMARRERSYQMIEASFYKRLLPFIMAFHQETASYTIHSQEFLAYEEKYLQDLQGFAQEHGMVLEDYAQIILGLRGEVLQHLKDRAKEDFIFLLIAEDLYGKAYDYEDYGAYEDFIESYSIMKGLDPIRLREDLSFDFYQKEMPRWLYIQELFEYFYPQYEFRENS